MPSWGTIRHFRRRIGWTSQPLIDHVAWEMMDYVKSKKITASLTLRIFGES